MWKIVEIALLIALPVAWGLAVEYVFERLRRRHGHRPQEGPHDWVI